MEEKSLIHRLQYHCLVYKGRLEYFLISIKPYFSILFLYLFILILFFGNSQGIELVEISSDIYYEKKTLEKLLFLLLLLLIVFPLFILNIYNWSRELEKKNITYLDTLEGYDYQKIFEIQYFIRLSLTFFLPVMYTIVLLSYNISMSMIILLLLFAIVVFISFKLRNYGGLKIGRLQRSYNKLYKPNSEKINVISLAIGAKLKSIAKFELELKAYDLETHSLADNFDFVRKRNREITSIIKNHKKEISNLEKTLFEHRLILFESKNRILQEYRNEFSNVLGKGGKKFAIVIHLLVLLVFLVDPRTLLLSSILGPVLGTLLGLLLVFNIILSIYFLSARSKLPIFVFVFGWILFCSIFNNNHRILVSNEPLSEQIVSSRQNLDNYISDWIEKKKHLMNSDTNYVYLISAEGGGIRSAYWTSKIIEILDSTSTLNIMDKTISLSGVSGGSIGLVNYCLYKEYKNTDPNCSLDKVYNADLITPTITGLLFLELLQKFIPIPINRWDRTRRIEDAWSHSFSEHISPDVLDAGLVRTWNTSGLPAIFLNCTKVENGKKAVFSTVRLNNSSEDIFHIMNQDVPIKSAAMSSARFPYITPPGKIIKSDKTYWGNIVDGGYLDNSGLHTTFEVIKAIKKNESILKYNVIPVIIYLKNSEEVKSTPSDFFIETTAPISTFVNSWDARIDYYYPDLTALSEKYNFKIITFPLNRGGTKLPLAWSFSKNTKQSMNNIIISYNESLQNVDPKTMEAIVERYER